MKKIIGAAVLALMFCAPARARFDVDSAIPVKAASGGLAGIAAQIEAILESSGTVTLAVVPAEASADNERTMTATLTYEETWALMFLLDRFHGAEGFSIVERTRLDRLLAEQKLTYMGMLTQGVEPGNLAGVNYILFITEMRWIDAAQISYKLVDLRTAKVIAAAVSK